MDLLPTEIIRLIFGHLDPRVADGIRQVCSSWFKISDKRSFTLYLIKDNNTSQLKDIFSRYSVPIELRFKKTKRISEELLAQALISITSLTSLSITTDRSNHEAWRYLTVLSGLKQLKIEDPPMDLIEKLPQLNKLHSIRSCEFTDKVQLFSALSALQDLTISFSDQDDYTGLLPSLTNPSLLTKLSLNGSNMSDYASITRFYNLKHLVLDYWSTLFESDPPFRLTFSALESLTISSTNISLVDVTLSTNLTYLKVSGGKCNNWQSFSRLTKLKTLKFINFDHFINTENEEGSGDEDLVFLTNLASLQNIHIDSATSRSCGRFSEYLFPHITKLTYASEQGVDLDWNRLMNLRDLSISCEDPNEDDKLTNMEKLSQLTRLRLKVHYANARLVKKMTQLKALQLQSAVVNIIELDADNMTKLEELSLENLTIDAQHNRLLILTQLTSFSTNAAVDLTQIAAWTNLRYLKAPLQLDNNHNEEQMLLLRLTNLRDLWVPELTDGCLEQFTMLKNLTFLMSMRSESNGEVLKLLTSLQRITFNPRADLLSKTKAQLREELYEALPSALSILLI